jgi:hypothetical protein
MISGTMIFLSVVATINHSKIYQSFHILVYVVGTFWQIVCFFTGYSTTGKGQPEPVLFIGNFTTFEIVVALIGLIIGGIICTISYHDFGLKKEKEKNMLL